MELWWLFCCLGSVKGASILFVAPVPEYSHFSAIFRLAKELSIRGDNVTVISPFSIKEPIKNYNHVSLEGIKEHIEQNKGNRWNNFGILKEGVYYLNLGLIITDLTLTNSNVQKLLNSGKKFDLVIVQYYYNFALDALGQHFNAPVISMCASYGITYNYYLANPESLSFVPSLLTPLKHPMNFWGRLENFLTTYILGFVKKFYFIPQHQKLLNKYVTKGLQLEEILSNVSVGFVNTHVSLRDAAPRVPNIIEIGGFHIEPHGKLPNDLENFLDSGNEGVILFSMGSNLKSKDFDLETRKIFFEAFSKIKQKVLWKFEAQLSGFPPNVKIVNWLPQQAVLAHPNVVAFISHGGHLSTLEAVYFGKPIIGIPIYGDQNQNVAYGVKNGYAIKVSLSEMTSEKLHRALVEIVTNPKYRENIQKRSQSMRDRPVEPLDWALYWVQHVIRHKGAPHLRSPGVDLTWYQRELLDVILFLIIFLVTITTTIIWLAKSIFKVKKIN